MRLSIAGFASPWVTMTICGNEARRGSGDCALTGSITEEFGEPGMPLEYNFPVVAPPTDCPCIVRVIGKDQSEIATAPIVISGHPVGPVIDPPVVGPLMKVGVTVELARTDLVDGLRASLGGPASYDVTVTVRNISDIPLKNVRLAGTGGKGANDIITTLPFNDPGILDVGRTWQQTVTVTIPSPSFGAFDWRVTASGAGPAVTGVAATQHRPWLLIVLVLTVVLLCALVLLRVVARRHQPKEGDDEVREEELVGSH